MQAVVVAAFVPTACSYVWHACAAVGHFRELVNWCERDPQRAKTVQRVLKLMRGWDAAAAHALSAVPADTRPRAFFAGNGLALLYACRNGKVDFEQTTGEHKHILRMNYKFGVHTHLNSEAGLNQPRVASPCILH